MDVFNALLLTVYIAPACVLMLFALNLYAMLFFFLRRKRQARHDTDNLLQRFRDRFADADLPHIVTQIPLYNEYNVAERVMRAAARMSYPAGRHTIQVLDDSTDGTCELVDRVADDLRASGTDVQVVRRPSREGFKAGALEYGLNRTTAEYFAIFDADFVPPEDFLRRTIAVMLLKSNVGIVQARWGHLNRGRSLVTRAQGVGIDGHFAVEQTARAWNNFFMNFNGTAGLWRRQAIVDAGGWEHDTLTEDMDLSYRSQLAGWQPYFLLDLVVPAEIPEDINAFKSQQFRWAKGSIQTAIKLLPRVFRSKLPLVMKVQAFFHMTHYIIHPIMLWLAIMALPLLLLTTVSISGAVFAVIFALFILSTLAPTFLYAVSQCCLYKRGWKRLALLPFLTSLGVGIAISNTRAVAEAIGGHESPFIRTPKRGDSEQKVYSVRMPFLMMLELFVGAYCFASLGYYLNAERYFIGPFLLLYAVGFTAVGVLSLIHHVGQFRWARATRNA